MAPAIFKPSPPSPAWRDHTSANGSTRDPTTSAGNPSVAPVRGATTPTGPATVTPTGTAPVSYLMAQASIVTPTPVRPPVIPGVIPHRPSRGSPQTNGSNGPQTNGTSDTLSDSRDEEHDSDSDSSSPDDDESALSSDDEPQAVSAAGIRHWMRHHKGLGNSVPWRSTPPLGSFHVDRPRSNQRPPARPPRPPVPSDESSESTDDQRHELWAKVANQRLTLQRIKASLAEKRREVRALRARKDRIDNSFMQLIRPHLTSSRTVMNSGRPVTIIPTDEIERRFGEMQRIRNDYYSAESTLELLEADMDREESVLESLETEFYHFLDPGSTGESSDAVSDPEDESESDKDDDTASRHTLLGISAVLADDIHPLYQQLLDAAGDRELAKEHLLELEGRHNKILYELERTLHLERARNNPGNMLTPAELQELKESLNYIPTQPEEFVAKFGVSIDKDDMEFLQDYPREQRAARIALDETTHKVDRLREMCTEQNVMRRNAPLYEDFAIHTGTSGPPFVPEGNITLDDTPSKTLAHPIFPILLSNPSHVLEKLSPHEALERAMKLPADHPSTAQKKAECLKELGIDNLMKKKVDGKPDYINQWLIHRLRTSPMEVELMFSISRAMFHIVNLRRWQEDVLYYWRKDAAAMRRPEDFRGPLTPRDDLDVDDDRSGPGVNSEAEASVRARSERGRVWSHRRTDSRSVQSV